MLAPHRRTSSIHAYLAAEPSLGPRGDGEGCRDSCYMSRTKIRCAGGRTRHTRSAPSYHRLYMTHGDSPSQGPRRVRSSPRQVQERSRNKASWQARRSTRSAGRHGAAEKKSGKKCDREENSSSWNRDIDGPLIAIFRHMLHPPTTLAGSSAPTFASLYRTFERVFPELDRHLERSRRSAPQRRLRWPKS